MRAMRIIKRISLIILLLIIITAIGGFVIYQRFSSNMRRLTLPERLQYSLEQAAGQANGDCSMVFSVYRAGDGFSWNGAVGALTQDTPYALASITKMYTTAVILQLVHEGLMGLDDPVTMYLPEEMTTGLLVLDDVDYTSTITVRHLMSHTSGLPDYFTESSPAYTAVEEIRLTNDITYDMAELMERTASLEPHFVPGSGEAFYSDLNFQLLGVIIEKISGRSLAEVYNTRIFALLGLKHTYLKTNIDDWEIADICYEGHLLKVPGIVASERSTGGIVSTSRENMVFLQAFFSGGLFPKTYLDDMQNWKPIQFFPMQYGMGLMRAKPPVPLFLPAYELIGHAGSLGTVSFYCPVRDIYITGSISRPDTAKAMMTVYRLLICFNFD